MNEIYVTGHRNPDTDSVVAAISYAALRNALGDRDYVAAHLGHISDETQRLLDRFGFRAPRTLSNVRTQVRDLDYDTPPALNSTVTMDRAWHIMRDQNISAMPIINEDGTLYGMLSAGDIAAYSMRTISDRHVDALPLFNLLSVIEGRILNDGAEQVDRVSGVVTIALPQSCDNLLFSDPDSIILCGNQPDMIRRALDIGVQCIILCQTDVTPRGLKTPARPASSPPRSMPAAWRGWCIRRSRSPARATRRIWSASTSMITLTTCVRSCSRALPLLPRARRERKGRRHALALSPAASAAQARRTRRPQRDGAGRARARAGGNSGDHRPPPSGRYSDHTAHPRAQRARRQHDDHHHQYVSGARRHAVAEHGGSDGERHFVRHGHVQVPHVHETRHRHGRAHGPHRQRPAQGAGQPALAASSAGDKSAEELCFTDFKEFHIADHYLGVGQVTSLDSAKVLERKDELLAVMATKLEQQHYDMIALMVTDVLLEGTNLLYIGSDDTIRAAFSVEPKDSAVFLPGVMSRKKQIIPMLTALWG